MELLRSMSHVTSVASGQNWTFVSQCPSSVSGITWALGKHANVSQPFDVTWINVAHGGSDAPTTEKLGEVINGLTSALKAQRLDVIDYVLRMADVERMSMEAMIAFLRVPFVVRDRLGEWRGFLRRAKAEAHRRGLDDPRLFRGLA